MKGDIATDSVNEDDFEVKSMFEYIGKELEKVYNHFVQQSFDCNKNLQMPNRNLHECTFIFDMDMFHSNNVSFIPHWNQKGKEYVEKIKGIYCFKVSKQNKEGTWVIDVKNGNGSVKFDPQGGLAEVLIKIKLLKSSADLISTLNYV